MSRQWCLALCGLRGQGHHVKAPPTEGRSSHGTEPGSSEGCAPTPRSSLANGRYSATHQQWIPCPFQHCGYLKPQGWSLEFYTDPLTVRFRQLVYSSKASFITNTTGLTHNQ